MILMTEYKDLATLEAGEQRVTPFSRRPSATIRNRWRDTRNVWRSVR